MDELNQLIYTFHNNKLYPRILEFWDFFPLNSGFQEFKP